MFYKLVEPLISFAKDITQTILNWLTVHHIVVLSLLIGAELTNVHASFVNGDNAFFECHLQFHTFLLKRGNSS